MIDDSPYDTVCSVCLFARGNHYSHGSKTAGTTVCPSAKDTYPESGYAITAFVSSGKTEATIGVPRCPQCWRYH
jgi:hypothetical protein